MRSPGVRSVMRWVSWIWATGLGTRSALCSSGWSRIWRGNRRVVRICVAMLVALAIAGVAARVVKIAAGRARPSVEFDCRLQGPAIHGEVSRFSVRAHDGIARAFFGVLAFATSAAVCALAADSAADRILAHVCRCASSSPTWSAARCWGWRSPSGWRTGARFELVRSPIAARRIRLAEGVGFEPTRACALPVFKTGAINHSTTPPVWRRAHCSHRLRARQACLPMRVPGLEGSARLEEHNVHVNI